MEKELQKHTQIDFIDGSHLLVEEKVNTIIDRLNTANKINQLMVQVHQPNRTIWININQIKRCFEYTESGEQD